MQGYFVLGLATTSSAFLVLDGDYWVYYGA